jgi:hypothetical protein
MSETVAFATDTGTGYPDWPYKAGITIADPVATINFQHVLILAWQEGMRLDFSDIRFSQENGVRCPYWIRSDNIVSGVSCEVWIKVPDASQSKIYIHWGYAGAVSESSGDATFRFFDDFIGSAVDTAKWTSTTTLGTITVSNSAAVLVSTNDSGDVSLAGKTTMDTSGCITARIKPKHFNTDAYYEAMLAGDWWKATTWFCSYDLGVFYTASGEYESADKHAMLGVTADTYCIARTRLATDAITYDIDGANAHSPDASYVAEGAIFPTIRVAWLNAETAVDWIFMRDYAATEPTLTLSSLVSADTPISGIFLSTTYTESASFGVNYGFTVSSTRDLVETTAFTVRYGFIASGITFKPTTQDALVIGGESQRNLSGKTWVCKLRYNKGITGGLSSSMFDTNIYLLVPDHTGTNRCIFCGYFPSQTARYEPANNSEEFTGYDYAMKLTGQVLPDNLLEILAPDNQDTDPYQRMDIKAITHQFHIGKLITGATSGAVARIAATPGHWLYSADLTESYLVPSSELVLSNVSGTFQDSEAVAETGGTGAASVDGALSPLDFGVSTYYPEVWLREVLGGDNWQNTTGIYPYRLNPVGTVSGSWTPKPYDTWFFQSAQTKMQAIEELAAYHNFIFLVKWKDIGIGDYTPVAYFVHQDDIDISGGAATEHQGLDLPDKVTITASTDTYLVGSVDATIAGEGKVNKVTIRCQDVNGVWYQNTPVSGTTESAAVFSGGEIPVEYFKEDPNLVSQADCDTAAALLYSYLSMRISTYKAVFRQRTDFELLQLIAFSGYTEIPDGDYRIIDIRYTWEAAAVFVHVTLIPQSQFKASLNVNRMYINSTLEIQRIIRAEMAKQPAVVAGTVTDISGNLVKGVTEAGTSIISRKMA